MSFCAIKKVFNKEATKNNLIADNGNIFVPRKHNEQISETIVNALKIENSIQNKLPYDLYGNISNINIENNGVTLIPMSNTQIINRDSLRDGEITNKEYNDREFKYRENNKIQDRYADNTVISMGDDLQEKIALKESSKYKEEDKLHNTPSKNEIAKNTIKDLALRASKRTGVVVRFEDDFSKPYKGYISDNQVVINLSKATLDTPIHEILAHPVIDTIKKTNSELYNKLLEEVEENGEHILNEVKRVYKNVFTEESQFYEEAMVQMLGKLTADRINNKSAIAKLWSLIKDFVKKLINAPFLDVSKLPLETSLKDLADVLAYSDNQLLLVGDKLEVVTPDGKVFNNEVEAKEYWDNQFADIEQSDNNKDTQKTAENANIIAEQQRIAKETVETINNHFSPVFNHNIEELYKSGKILEASIPNVNIINLEQELDELYKKIEAGSVEMRASVRLDYNSSPISIRVYGGDVVYASTYETEGNYPSKKEISDLPSSINYIDPRRHNNNKVVIKTEGKYIEITYDKNIDDRAKKIIDKFNKKLRQLHKLERQQNAVKNYVINGFFSVKDINKNIDLSGINRLNESLENLKKLYKDSSIKKIKNKSLFFDEMYVNNDSYNSETGISYIYKKNGRYYIGFENGSKDSEISRFEYEQNRIKGYDSYYSSKDFEGKFGVFLPDMNNPYMVFNTIEEARSFINNKVKSIENNKIESTRVNKTDKEYNEERKNGNYNFTYRVKRGGQISGETKYQRSPFNDIQAELAKTITGNKNLQISEDGMHYVDLNTGIKYKRVTSLTADMPVLARYAIARGTILDATARRYIAYMYDNYDTSDELIRDKGFHQSFTKEFKKIFLEEYDKYVNDPANKIDTTGFTEWEKQNQNVYEIYRGEEKVVDVDDNGNEIKFLTDPVINAYYGIMLKYRRLFEKGFTIMSEIPTMSGEIKYFDIDGNEKTELVAGTPDLVLKAPTTADGQEGDIYFVDFKTTNHDYLSNDIYEKYVIQQNLYAELFTKATGLEVKGLFLDIFKVKEEEILDENNKRTGNSRIVSISRLNPRDEFYGIPIDRRYVEKGMNHKKPVQDLLKAKKKEDSVTNKLIEFKENEISKIEKDINFLESRIKVNRNKEDVEKVKELKKQLTKIRSSIKVFRKGVLLEMLETMYEDIEDVVSNIGRNLIAEDKSKIMSFEQASKYLSRISFYTNLNTEIFGKLAIEYSKQLKELIAENPVLELISKGSASKDDIDEDIYNKARELSNLVSLLKDISSRIGDSFKNKESGIIIRALKVMIENEIENDGIFKAQLDEINSIDEVVTMYDSDDNITTDRSKAVRTIKQKRRKHQDIFDRLGDKVSEVDVVGEDGVTRKEKRITAKDLIYPDRDINWFEKLFTGIVEGNDSYITQYLYREISKHFAFENAIAQNIIEEMNVLSYKLDGKDINALVNDDFSLIDDLSKEWHSIQKDRARLMRNINKSLSLYDVKNYHKDMVDWIRENTDVINPFLIPEVIERYYTDNYVGHYFKNEDGSKFSVGDDYKNELIKRVGGKRYNEIVSSLFEQIDTLVYLNEEKEKAAETAVSEGKDFNPDSYNYKIITNNVLDFLKGYFEGKSEIMSTIGKSENFFTAFDATAERAGLQFLPKKDKFVNHKFLELMKNDDIRRMYELMKQAGEYIGNTYNMKTYDKVYIPMFKKEFGDLIGTVSNIHKKHFGEFARDLSNGMSRLFSVADKGESKNKDSKEVKTNLDLSYKYTHDELLKAYMLDGTPEKEAEEKVKKEIDNMFSKDFLRSLQAGLILASQHKARLDMKDKTEIFTHIYNEIKDFNGEYRKNAIERNEAFVNKVLYNQSHSHIDKSNKRSYSPEEIKIIQEYEKLRDDIKKDDNFLENGKVFIDDKIDGFSYKFRILRDVNGKRFFMFNNHKIDTKEDFLYLLDRYIKAKKEKFGRSFYWVEGGIALLHQLSIYKGLMFSPSGGVFNRLEGKTTNFIWDASGIYWKPGAMAMAESMLSFANTNKYITDITGALIPNYNKNANRMKKFENVEIIRQVLKRLGGLQTKQNVLDQVSEREKGLSDNFMEALFRFAVEDPEFKNQASIAIAILNDTKVKYTDEKGVEKEVPIVDDNGNFTCFALDKEGKLIVKEGYDFSLNSNAMYNLQSRIQATVAQIQGNYLNSDNLLIKNNLFGKAFSGFQGWWYSHLYRRFRINDDYNIQINPATGKVLTDGVYVDLYKRHKPVLFSASIVTALVTFGFTGIGLSTILPILLSSPFFMGVLLRTLGKQQFNKKVIEEKRQTMDDLMVFGKHLLINSLKFNINLFSFIPGASKLAKSEILNPKFKDETQRKYEWSVRVFAAEMATLYSYMGYLAGLSYLATYLLASGDGDDDGEIDYIKNWKAGALLYLMNMCERNATSLQSFLSGSATYKQIVDFPVMQQLNNLYKMVKSFRFAESTMDYFYIIEPIVPATKGIYNFGLSLAEYGAGSIDWSSVLKHNFTSSVLNTAIFDNDLSLGGLLGKPYLGFMDKDNEWVQLGLQKEKDKAEKEEKSAKFSYDMRKRNREHEYLSPETLDKMKQEQKVQEKAEKKAKKREKQLQEKERYYELLNKKNDSTKHLTMGEKKELETLSKKKHINKKKKKQTELY